MASLTHVLSLSIATFSIAGTRELNIVYVLSFVDRAVENHDRGVLVYVPPATVTGSTGHASGWFFQ